MKTPFTLRMPREVLHVYGDLHNTRRKSPELSTGTNLPFESLLDTAEAASLLQIHPKTLQKLARAGKVTGIRIGKLWRFRASALDEWLAGMAG